MDVDSTICEVCGHHKQGAGYGYTRTLGYHPLLATRADSGEVLHARLRKGSANTARGIPRFVDVLVARLRRAGAVGELTLRMDSGPPWPAHSLRAAVDTASTRRLALGALLPDGTGAASLHPAPHLTPPRPRRFPVGHANPSHPALPVLALRVSSGPTYGGKASA